MIPYYLLVLECAASEIWRINETLLLLIADTGVFRALRQSQEYKTTGRVGKTFPSFLQHYINQPCYGLLWKTTKHMLYHLVPDKVFSILTILWFKQLYYQQAKKPNIGTKQKIKNKEKLSLPTKLGEMQEEANNC